MFLQNKRQNFQGSMNFSDKMFNLQNLKNVLNRKVHVGSRINYFNRFEYIIDFRINC